MAHETTLYSVLRVPENATPEELKQAYRKLVKLWHPDLHPDDMSAEKRMAEINEAYTVLSDPAKKLKYDNSLSSKRAAQRAKEEEQARKAARAAAAAAAAKAAANAGARAGSGAAPVRKPYNDPDRPVRTDSSYEDFRIERLTDIIRYSSLEAAVFNTAVAFSRQENDRDLIDLLSVHELL